MEKKSFNPKILMTIGAIIIIGGISFYGGMVFGKSSNKMGTRNSQGFANFASGQNSVRQGGVGQRGGQGGMTFGEIASKDNESLTLKLANSGSKIVFYSTSTEILKSAVGSVSDLTVGSSITVSGQTNADGSLTAKSIQLRNASSSPIGR